MNTIRTHLKLRRHSKHGSDASGSEGNGGYGSRPELTRGAHSSAGGCRSIRDVRAAGELPRSATRNDGGTADGVSAAQGIIVLESALLPAIASRIGSVLVRIAGACGMAGHARTSGRKQGARVTGSGDAAVGGSSAGVSSPVLRGSFHESRETAQTRPGIASNRENAEARPGIASNRENAEAHPGIASNRENAEAHPGIASNRENTEAHPGIASNRENAEAHPGIASNRENAEAHPGIESNRENESIGGVHFRGGAAVPGEGRRQNGNLTSSRRDLMNTIYIPVVLALLLALLFAAACEDDIAPVIPPDPPAPLDTTSHDFVWDFDTVGVAFSLIKSIAVVSPTDYWVTGQFFRYDSLGRPDSRPVGNVAHWNGKTWTMHGFNSSGHQSWYEMDDAFARGPDNVWVCGGSPFQWNGAKWITHGYEGFYFGSGIIETWVSADAKYACVVGLDRSCAYYRADDPYFRKVQIPHQGDCLDVTGLEDGTMYVAAGCKDPYGGYIYRVTPDRKAEVYCIAATMDPYAIWIQDGAVHFASTKVIWRVTEDNLGTHTRAVYEADLNIVEEDHEEENSIFLMQQRGCFLHWNGSTWKQIAIPYPGVFLAHDLDVCGKDIYFVGFGTGQYCVIAHGRQL